jgi:transposase
MVKSINARHLNRPLEVLFVDESHFTNEPYGHRGGFRKGQQTRLPQPVKRQSATVFGARHLRTQRFYWKRAARGTSKVFIAFLHQLHQRFRAALLVLILDPASIHTSRVVKRFVKCHDWVDLEHLSPYSPADNPMERFWGWLKAKVDGAIAFDTIEAVIAKMRQLLWHYHEGWLTTSIHFDFAPDAQILCILLMRHLGVAAASWTPKRCESGEFREYV